MCPYSANISSEPLGNVCRLFMLYSDLSICPVLYVLWLMWRISTFPVHNFQSIFKPLPAVFFCFVFLNHKSLILENVLFLLVNKKDQIYLA